MTDKLINDFFPGGTVAFIFDITKNGLPLDISSDAMTLRVKLRKSDNDASALITQNGDLTTSSVVGRALFSLTPLQTKISPNDYYLDIEWVRSDGSVHIIQDQDIRVKERVSDS